MRDENVSTISIIVPHSPNEEVRVMDSLKGLSYPKQKIEIITVEGYSPSKQRNEGIRKAEGELLAFLDSHSTVTPDWLEKAVKYFNRDVAMIGGPVLASPPKENRDTNISSFFATAMGTYFGTGPMHKRYEAVGIGPTKASESSLILCNLFVRKHILEKEGAFDEELFPNEENELMVRLQDKGYKLLYVPQLVAYHPPEKDFGALSRKILGYGRGRAFYIFKRLRSFGLVYMLPSLFLLFLIATPFLFTIQSLKFLTALILLSYFLVNGIFSLYIGAKKKNWRYAVVLPIVYLTIHLSYGLGFILGKFWKSNHSPNAETITRITKLA
jgi:GT2 family glycosyltransferase